MPAQSKYGAFLAALATRLDLVDAGADYHNTFTVVRCPAFREEYLDPSVASGVLAFLVPGRLTPRVATFGGAEATVLCDARVDLLIAKRYESGDDPFEPPTVDRWEWQARLAQDAVKVLHGDRGVAAGGVDTCLNLTVDDIEMAPEETFHQVWAVVFISLVARIQWAVGAP
jgi:hypothetical protein